MLEIGRCAFLDPRGFWDDRGNLKLITELSADHTAALAGFEAVAPSVYGCNVRTGPVHKIKFWNNLQALELLAKHFQLLKEVVKVEASEDLLKLLNEGRARVAAARAACQGSSIKQLSPQHLTTALAPLDGSDWSRKVPRDARGAVETRVIACEKPRSGPARVVRIARFIGHYGVGLPPNRYTIPAEYRCVVCVSPPNRVNIPTGVQQPADADERYECSP